MSCQHGIDDLREATTQDIDAIEKVYKSAFPEEESESVTKLAVQLLKDNETSPKIYSFVALLKNTVVGHVSFSPVVDANDVGFRGYILAPLAVQSDYHKHGIGSKLVKHGLEQLTNVGVHAVFVYGDPGYYGRFGFRADIAENTKVDYEVKYPSGWQGLILNDCHHTETGTRNISVHAALCDEELW
ncbi:hypothetical protein HJC23_009608 [Cyclotella cryptica]|uniref:N-acetyltransferase domain-containing protein n=1 Tax=Cyclotella cryptica TaxID=29204 RepID=A0ABD3NX57_9STRA|eukprot:CCRYP_019602-RA/>CCRYP_019602-RA protein AED:0.04 eAED:0.04 QI:132/1/1/1/0/0/2/454/185